jgi:hypothetical protein
MIVSFVTISYAQEGSLFNYEVQRVDEQNYTVQIQLADNSNTEYIQIHLLEKNNVLMVYEASLNKKSDGKYYLFFEGVETEVSLDNIELNFNHGLGLLLKPALIVKLIDKDFNQIDAFQKIIE